MAFQPPLAHTLSSETFQVAPQIKRFKDSDSMNSTVIHIIMERKVTVFFVEVETYLVFDRGRRQTITDEKSNALCTASLSTCKYHLDTRTSTPKLVSRGAV